MKAREERQKVMVRARMRSGASWDDVCIVNLSLHGVGIQAAKPPARGTYVEIRRGSNVIVARVAWTKGHRAGLRSQDAIFIHAVLREQPANPPTVEKVERRKMPRAPVLRHEDSRLAARAMEFACLTIVACALAVGAFGAVEGALARPLSQISDALG